MKGIIYGRLLYARFFCYVPAIDPCIQSFGHCRQDFSVIFGTDLLYVKIRKILLAKLIQGTVFREGTGPDIVDVYIVVVVVLK